MAEWKTVRGTNDTEGCAANTIPLHSSTQPARHTTRCSGRARGTWGITMGHSSVRGDSTAGQGRRARVAGGFPFQRRIFLTEQDGALLTTLAAQENLSVGAYLARLVERHVAGSRDPLPASAHDLLTAINTTSNDLRAMLHEARAEGVLLNQIARHLNTQHPTVHGVPDALVDMLGRTLVRHQTTTMAIDELLTRTDRLLATAVAVLGRRPKARGGTG
jgi:hypothetical protein